MKMNYSVILSVSLLCVLVSFSNAQTNTTFQVGVILDLDSLVGRIGLTSLSLALSDFYTVNANYSTRLQLHVNDSSGRLSGAAATAINLLKDVKVDAIIGPQKSAQAGFVIDLANTAKVPVISFSATSPSLHALSPYFVQTALSDAAQVTAIAAIVKNFGWSQVVFVYEDSDYGSGIIPYLSNAFQEVNTRISYRCVIPVSASDDFILRELYKMKTMQTRVFIVHISSSLASRFFPKAKEAEMMTQGYAWILTNGLMELFHSLDSQVVESMQGVLGVKPLIPESRKLRSTTTKWKQKLLLDYGISLPEMTLFGLCAYDTLWALALAAERVGFREANTAGSNSTNMFVTEVSLTGPKLLQAVSGTTFQGLSGSFRLTNGQLEPSSFQIVNVVGKELREVGIWTLPVQVSNEVSSSPLLQGVTWPGGESTAPPKGWEIPVSGKILKIAVPAPAGFPEFVTVERDPQTNATKFSGYYIDLFDNIVRALPYAIRYKYVPFETTNASISQTYDQLSYQVSIGTFDAAVGDITITANRSQYADFSLPIGEGGVTRIQKIEYDNPNQWFFLWPLEKGLWLTAIALFVFTGVALWILEHRINEAFRGPPSEQAGLIFYIPFISLVLASSERIVSNLGRLVIVVFLFVVLILNSTYTANLSATLTTLNLLKVDTDVSVLIKNGDYVGCRKGSFIVSYLEKQLGFDRAKIRTYNDPQEIDAALSKGSQNEGITAFFSCVPYTDLFMSKYCNKYMKVGSPYLTQGYAVAFPKGSPLVAGVSRAIIELTDSGSISEIKGRWIKQTACNDNKPNPSDAVGNGMSLKSFRVLFGITAGVTAVCLALFLASYLYKNRDFVGRIFNSSATTLSKIRAMCRHFDLRDTKFVRTESSVNLNAYAGRRSAVVPVSSDEGVGPNSTAAAEQQGSV